MNGRKVRRIRKIILAGFLRNCEEKGVNPADHFPISRKTFLSALRHGELSPQSERFDESAERARAMRRVGREDAGRNVVPEVGVFWMLDREHERFARKRERRMARAMERERRARA